MSRHGRSECAVGFLVWLFSVGVVVACGPCFPNTVLGDAEDELLQPPHAHFFTELQRLYPAMVMPPSEDGAGESVYRAATNDLQSCLLKDGQLTPREHRLSEAFDQTRSVLYLRRREVMAREAARRWRLPCEGGEEKPALPEVVIPKGLPPEFEAYLRGAAAWVAADTVTAQRAWSVVLELPAQQRHYRSTWAVFMLGKSLMTADPEQAVEHFEQVRALAANGFRDSLGLSRESLGWQAYTELRRGGVVRAIELYLDQYLARDVTAVNSLRFSIAELVRRNDTLLVTAAGNSRVRPVVTAYLLSRDREPTVRWMEAIEAAGVPLVEGAGRLAWAAYSAGEMVWAEKWASRACEDSCIACWIQAKLCLRKGETEQAKRRLARVMEMLTEEGAEWEVDAKPKVASELAVLQMASGAYVQALDLLIRNGWWWDGAYVAEGVLSIDELRQYVDEGWPQDGDAVSEQIRSLLARRLARGGRFGEARAYFPPLLQTRIESFAGLLALGRDAGEPGAKRAEALWKAANLMRYEGLGLFGTELAPDWFVVEGMFELGYVTEWRFRPTALGLAAPSQDEVDRVKANSESRPRRRHHYRYAACDLAWEAAGLMPDNSDVTADVLCQAGSWIKYRDPAAADRFYKALVNRCRKTDLGQDADRIRWFP